MQLSKLRRNQIASLLGFTLIILTISVAGAGYFTYLNLNKIVSQLETENLPDNNLLLYKEIMVALTGMKNQVEFYQLTEENSYLEAYNDYTELVSLYLDSINSINRQDPDLLTFNDSLAHLIDRKTDVLNKLLKLTPEKTNNDLSQLEEKLDKIPDFVKKETNGSDQPQEGKSPDTTDITSAVAEVGPNEVEEEEQGWLKKGLKKLFSSNKKNKETEPSQEEEVPKIVSSSSPSATERSNDSILTVKANKYKAELSDEIRKIRASSEQALKEMKNQEMELETTHFDIQNQIMDLISYLESRESLKLELNTLHAKELTSRTNQQILTFTILGTLLLMTSLVILLNYYNKSMKYQELLQEAKKSTETLARAKERFFANMSHEIRTPMNAISGFTKILLKSDLNSDQREQVEIINKSSEHLLKLLNDILDFSKLQAEKLQLESVPFDPKEVCLDVLKLLQESATRKDLKLNHHFEGLPETVSGDPYRLRQILLNLLNNSIKYTEKGGVNLSVVAKPQKNDILLTIKISDTGIGISKSQQFRLFREFQQANQSSFSKGTGLGLAITKKLVLLHDQGKIDLKSTEGKGTIITLTLAYPISEKQARTEPTKDLAPQIGPLKALIADDEPFNIKLLATLLDRCGIKFDKATDGEEALMLLNQNEYDIVLLDLKMPKKNGWEIVQAIREKEGPNQHKPFIALTATISKVDQEKGTASGFDHILRKPFDENILFELIARKTNSPDIPMLQNKAAIDLSLLHQMGDKVFVADMVETFISSSEAGIISIENDLKNNDFDQIATTAHRIVAPARHFKAEKLVRMLKDLEKEAEQNDPSISLEMINEIKQELSLTFGALRESLEKEAAK